MDVNIREKWKHLPFPGLATTDKAYQSENGEKPLKMGTGMKISGGNVDLEAAMDIQNVADPVSPSLAK